MLKSNSLRLGVVLSTAIVLALPGVALAQKEKKQISYEEAFKRCKKFIDQEKGGLAHGTTNEQTRMARGSACMQKFGHRI